MSESATATLAAVASSPESVAASQAHMLAAIDAIVKIHCEHPPEGLNQRQAALRTPKAVWCAVLSHAENRVHNLPQK